MDRWQVLAGVVLVVVGAGTLVTADAPGTTTAASAALGAVALAALAAGEGRRA